MLSLYCLELHLNTKVLRAIGIFYRGSEFYYIVRRQKVAPTGKDEFLNL